MVDEDWGQLWIISIFPYTFKLSFAYFFLSCIIKIGIPILFQRWPVLLALVSCLPVGLCCVDCCYFAPFEELLSFHAHCLTSAHIYAQLPHPKAPSLTLLLLLSTVLFFLRFILHEKNTSFILFILCAKKSLHSWLLLYILCHSVTGHSPVCDLLFHRNCSGKGYAAWFSNLMASSQASSFLNSLKIGPVNHSSSKLCFPEKTFLILFQNPLACFLSLASVSQAIP